MRTMTLNEVKKLPKLSAQEIAEILNFKNKDFTDCPKQTDKDLQMFRRHSELREGMYKPTKTDVHLKIDSDVLDWFKQQGKGYQTKINAILRQVYIAAES